MRYGRRTALVATADTNRLRLVSGGDVVANFPATRDGWHIAYRAFRVLRNPERCTGCVANTINGKQIDPRCYYNL